jgi:hypothetical protein
VLGYGKRAYVIRGKCFGPFYYVGILQGIEKFYTLRRNPRFNTDAIAEVYRVLGQALAVYLQQVFVWQSLASRSCWYYGDFGKGTTARKA